MRTSPRRLSCGGTAGDRVRRRSVAILGIAGALAAAVVMAGCSDREHTNPFDPANPDTGGHPTDLSAVAEDGAVSLRWADLGIDDITGFQILRREREGPFSPLSPSLLPRGVMQYTDRAVTAHTSYGYVLASYVADQTEPLLGSEEVATPGPARVWVADSSTGRAWLVAPDARDLATGVVVSAVVSDLAAVPEAGDVWVADYAGGRLVRLDPSGESVEPPLKVPEGVAAAAASDDGSYVFAGSFDSGIVTGYGPGRSLAWADDSTFTSVEDLAWSSESASLWVADGRGRIARLDGVTGRRLSLLEGFVRPFALSIAPDGGAWLVDAGAADTVYKIDASGEEVVAVWQGLAGPADVAADPVGGCWVADLTGGKVVHLNDALTAILASTGNLASPRSLVLDPVAREVWIAESGIGRVTRISDDGKILTRVGGLVSPFELAAAWNPPTR